MYTRIMEGGSAVRTYGKFGISPRNICFSYYVLANCLKIGILKWLQNILVYVFRRAKEAFCKNLNECGLWPLALTLLSHVYQVGMGW